jgi:glycosyltransferase involved in cell wall biosynthesis
MIIVHLTASTFFGGPERQMLGLALALPPSYRSVFVSYSEGGRCKPFLDEARKKGFETHILRYDTPSFLRMVRELTEYLEGVGTDVLCCHTYKPNLLGRLAARRLGIPAVAVSRGWTAESLRVRVYEVLDRLNLRWMDRVICVSDGQADKVRRAGVPIEKVAVIRNAIQPERFTKSSPLVRAELERYFPRPVDFIVGAAGRLSPEKGFSDLIAAARLVSGRKPSVGFLLFGDGPLRDELDKQIYTQGLRESFVLTGFREDLDRLLPQLDLFVQSSYTEGLPNVLLEACAAGVTVLATDVGGTSEIIRDGITGYLVGPGQPERLADLIILSLDSEKTSRLMEASARESVAESFSFELQSSLYVHCFEDLLGRTSVALEAPAAASRPLFIDSAETPPLSRDRPRRRAAGSVTDW